MLLLALATVAEDVSLGLMALVVLTGFAHLYRQWVKHDPERIERRQRPEPVEPIDFSEEIYAYKVARDAEASREWRPV
jgi:hypothetical protein